jgi:4-azaleucine resistance transporter AzlC
MNNLAAAQHDGEAPSARLAPGARAGVPFALAGFLLSFSFGVVARPVMGVAAPIVMSVFVFAGSAQFAALAVLAARGSAVAAIVAGILLNLRFVPMGIALAPSLVQGAFGRAIRGQAIVDASWAMANRGAGRFDVSFMLGATAVQYVTWVAGTVLGVLGGSVIGDPKALGLDAIFPAFFLGLLIPELGSARGRSVAALGAAIALALTPLTPAGVPIIVASVAVLIGVRR